MIFQKEILDNMRDYRSWMTGFFWAMFGPLLLGGMIMLLGRTIRENVEQSLILPVAGAENAPSLIAFLEQSNIVIEPAPADPEAAVIAGDINVALIGSEDALKQIMQAAGWYEANRLGLRSDARIAADNRSDGLQ